MPVAAEPPLEAATWRPVKVNLGCGGDVRPDWTNCDRSARDGVIAVDLERALPFDRHSVHVIEICHALEHVVYWHQLLEECFRVLVPMGTLQIRVPDMDYAVRCYLTGEVPANERCVYEDRWGHKGVIDWHHLIFGAPAGRPHESNPHVTGFSWDTGRGNDLARILHGIGFRYVQKWAIRHHPFEIACQGTKP